MATQQDIIVDWIYYYPPSFSVNQVGNLTTDADGMVVMTINRGNIIPISEFGGYTVVNIKVTPQGFLSWYQNNQSTIASQSQDFRDSVYSFVNTLNSPINGFANYAANATAYLKAQGDYWIPYSQLYDALGNPTPQFSNYSVLQSLPSSAFFDTLLIGGTSQLYALVKSVSSPSIAVFNGLAAGGGSYTTQAVTPAIATQQAQATSNLNTQVSQNEITTDNTSTVGSTIVNGVDTAISNTAKTIQTDVSNAIPTVLIIGGLAVIAVILILQQLNKNPITIITSGKGKQPAASAAM